jgi:hypothetical protein
MDEYKDIALGVEAAWPAFLTVAAPLLESPEPLVTPPQQEHAFPSTPTPA